MLEYTPDPILLEVMILSLMNIVLIIKVFRFDSDTPFNQKVSYIKFKQPPPRIYAVHVLVF